MILPGLERKLQTEAQATFQNLKRLNWTLVTAESLTGGMVASTLVSLDGISKYFLDGVITYSDLGKRCQLHVGEDTLKTHTAVSREVAQEMAVGVFQRIGLRSRNSVGLATTGYAGPGDGPDGTPAGTYYVGIALDPTPPDAPDVILRKRVFKFQRKGLTRNEVRTYAALDALRELNKWLKEFPS